MSFSPQTLLRHWQTIRLIPREPRKITAGEICALLDKEGYRITKRTVERDLQALSSLFPLVIDERNKPFGWSWSKGAPSFDLPGISTSEALTFLMANEHLRHVMPVSLLQHLFPLFKLAEQKISSTVGQSAYAHWRDKIRIIPPSQPLLPQEIIPQVEADIHEALLHNWQCHITYQGRDRAKTEAYPISPLALIQRGSLIYLICTIKEYDDIRILALHRIQKTELLESKAKQNKAFNLDDYITNGAFGWKPVISDLADNKPVQVKLKFTSFSGYHLYETPLDAQQEITELAPGTIEVSATVMINQQLVWWILGFGEQIEVQEPATLRTVIATHIEAAHKLYSKK